MSFTVVLRTIKNKEHEVQVENDTSIERLFDATVEGFPSDFSKDAIVLVFKGKVLAADKSVGDYGLKDTDRIVVMSQKKKNIGKAPKAKKKEPEKKEEVTAPKVEDKKVPKSPAPSGEVNSSAPKAAVELLSQTNDSAAAAEQPLQAALASVGAGLMDTPVENEDEKVSNLTGMGFDERPARKFLRLVAGDVDKAAELLLETDGVSPEEFLTAEAAAPGADVSALGGTAASELGGEHNLPEGHPLYEFTQSSVFQEMREQVRANPAALPNFMMELFQSNPELGAQIVQNEDDFIRCLFGARMSATILDNMARRGDAERHAQAAMAQLESNLTESDHASIGRLMELGFSKPEAMEAYLACDRNEEAAANFLFDNQ